MAATDGDGLSGAGQEAAGTELGATGRPAAADRRDRLEQHDGTGWRGAPGRSGATGRPAAAVAVRRDGMAGVGGGLLLGFHGEARAD